MTTQRLKGLWIPAGILLNKDLSDKEKIILAIILYLSEENKSCFASVNDNIRMYKKSNLKMYKNVHS